MIKPQKEFSLFDQYKAKFPGINGHTIFAYSPDIYTDYKLTSDLLIHENTHLKQQEEIGLDLWVEKFLNDPQFRLDMEIEAYKKQLNSILDSKKRRDMTLVCAENLSSDLYDNIISLSEAFDILIKHG